MSEFGSQAAEPVKNGLVLLVGVYTVHDPPAVLPEPPAHFTLELHES